MKTYSVVSDVLGVIELPNEIESFDEAVEHVRDRWANGGEVRLVEHTWQCVSQAPFLIDTDYKT